MSRLLLLASRMILLPSRWRSERTCRNLVRVHNNFIPSYKAYTAINREERLQGVSSHALHLSMNTRYEGVLLKVNYVQLNLF